MFNLFVFRQFFLSVLAGICFGVSLSVPKKDLIISAVIGGIGWVINYIGFQITKTIVMPLFISTLVMGIIASYFAKTRKNPTLVYMIPGIIPLVPGLNMYYTMFNLVTKNFSVALHYLAQVVAIALSLSCGLILTKTAGKITDKIIEKVGKRKKSK